MERKAVALGNFTARTALRWIPLTEFTSPILTTAGYPDRQHAWNELDKLWHAGFWCRPVHGSVRHQRQFPWQDLCNGHRQQPVGPHGRHARHELDDHERTNAVRLSGCI